MSKYREHYCNKMEYKDFIKIQTMPLSHSKWVMNIINANIIIHDIKYCPYCGVKL